MSYGIEDIVNIQVEYEQKLKECKEKINEFFMAAKELAGLRKKAIDLIEGVLPGIPNDHLDTRHNLLLAKREFTSFTEETIDLLDKSTGFEDELDKLNYMELWDRKVFQKEFKKGMDYLCDAYRYEMAEVEEEEEETLD